MGRRRNVALLLCSKLLAITEIMRVRSCTPVIMALWILLFTLFSIPCQADLTHSSSSSQSFEFLSELLGSQKGDTVKGFHTLKQYLHQFGYLNNIDNSTNDSFDDLVESAIKTYQLNYHLKPTGTLDAYTVHQMMKPRCGVADIIDGTSSMRSGNHRHNTSSLLHTNSHYTFFRGNPRWPPFKTHLTYGFISERQEVVRNQDMKSAFSRAFERWSVSTSFTFEEIEDCDSADIKIGFFRGDHGDDFAFDGRGGVLAHAFAPTVGLFHLDADDEWAVDLDNTTSLTAFDLESVSLHEIGHLLGLGHSSVQDAVMFPSISRRERKVNLHGDDIQGIQALYGLW